MKKIIALLFVLSGIYITASAQTKGTTEFGVSIGYNGSTVTTGQYTNSNERLGLNFGVSADFYFSDRWSFKAKLSYDQKGWDDGFLNGSYYGFYTTNYRLNYITVPLMANWHFGRTRNWYLNFGPYVGFLLNAKETAGSTPLNEVFNTVDAGLDAGIGIKFRISDKAKFFIELNGQGGVTDIIKDNGGSALRNSTSALNVGINF